jgi:hypothetical protein
MEVNDDEKTNNRERDRGRETANIGIGTTGETRNDGSFEDRPRDSVGLGGQGETPRKASGMVDITNHRDDRLPAVLAVDGGRVNEISSDSDRRGESDFVVREVANVTRGEYSLKPKKGRSPRTKSEHSPCQTAGAEVVDLTAYKAAVTIHQPAVFADDKWKRSRIKKGYLIARVKGYDPVESEYGVHYLKVLSRKPKKTSGDYSLYEHAGFFTWDALQAGGRLVKERKRYERVSGDRANAS